MGTLHLRLCAHIDMTISLIVLYKSCSVATPEHSKPFSLENYVRIVALAPDLQKVSLYPSHDRLACQVVYGTCTLTSNISCCGHTCKTVPYLNPYLKFNIYLDNLFTNYSLLLHL
jgi:hypothetical protein